MWRQLSACATSELEIGDIAHVGIRTDGEVALILAADETGVAWHVLESRIRRFLPKEHRLLDRFLARGGFLNLNYGFGAGTYRVLGFRHNFPIVEHPDNGLGVTVDSPLQILSLYSCRSGLSVASFPVDTPGDDVRASFSDDGRVCIVVQRTSVIFFGYGSAEA